MRRWFEFGNDTGLITGKWSLDSNRPKGGPRPHEIGDYPAAFVSLPFKADLFSALTAISSSNPLTCLYLLQQDQGVDPDPGCPAEHIPRQFSANSVSTGQFFANPALQPWGGYAIFNENGTFTGTFSAPILTGPYFEPPSEN